jgi:hypothetical protein
METFTAPKPLVRNPLFETQKRSCLAGLTDSMIDEPIVEIVNRFNELPFCYTLQSCYGHFLYRDQDDPHNIEPLPDHRIMTPVEYRIAYIAFCIENCKAGRFFRQTVEKITQLDPENIQFCSAEWFWERHVNTYALQVEPDRFKHQDCATLDDAEARHIEAVRNAVYHEIRRLNWDRLNGQGSKA